jgi:hypothetical protein
MSDRTPEVVEFVRRQYPEIPVEHILKCIQSFTDWTVREVENDFA